MPLTPGEPVGDAIRELYHHGTRPRSMKQIEAIAFANHRRGHHALGGHTHLDAGGVPNNYYLEHMALREAAEESQYHPGGLIASDVSGRTDRLPMTVAADSFVVPADVIAGLGAGNTLAGARRMNEIIASPAPYGAGAAPRGREGHNIPSPPRPYEDPGAAKPFSGSLPNIGSGGQSPAQMQAGINQRMTTPVPLQPSDSMIAPVPVNSGNFIPPMLGSSRGGHEPKSDVILAGGEYSIPPEAIARIGYRMRKLGLSKARTDLAAGHEALREMVDRVRKHQMKFLKTAPKPKK